MINLQGLYSKYLPSSVELLDQLGVRDEVVHNDTVCLQVPSHERYVQLRAELAEFGELISESEVNGRLIAVIEREQAALR